MEASTWLKSYFLKVALPIVFVTLVLENAFTPGSYLASKLSYFVMGGSGQAFLLERGGLRHSGIRGPAYHESVNLHIYDGEAGRRLALKDFMVEHVTEYEPAIFLGLVDDWQAIQKWNLATGGDHALRDGFGDDLVQVLNYTASVYSYYWKSSEIDY